MFFCIDAHAKPSTVELHMIKADVAVFRVAGSFVWGKMEYIVDRTNGVCFARIDREDKSGFAEVDCQRLLVNPEIKKFWESGKAD